MVNWPNGRAGFHAATEMVKTRTQFPLKLSTQPRNDLLADGVESGLQTFGIRREDAFEPTSVGFEHGCGGPICGQLHGYSGRIRPGQRVVMFGKGGRRHFGKSALTFCEGEPICRRKGHLPNIPTDLQFDRNLEVAFVSGVRSADTHHVGANVVRLTPPLRVRYFEPHPAVLRNEML